MDNQLIVKGKTIKQVRKLNLSGQGLKEIPADVFLYTNLTKLVLSRNAIKKIPKEIAKLKKLEVLDLTYNNLDHLPAPIFKLPKLRVLSVGHNKIKKFPIQLVGSSIKQLIADHNQIEKIDSESLNGLEKLVISYNPISGQIFTHEMPELKYYDFRHTNLDYPPEGFIAGDCKCWRPDCQAAITKDMITEKKYFDSMANNQKDTQEGNIFISHSSKDAPIVSKFVDHILRLGIGIPLEKINCTSIEGIGIENGEKMREWIHDKIDSCSLAFLMISPSYRKSEICLNEMGAIWAYEKPVKILLFPCMQFKNFGWLEEVRQAGHIDDDKALDQLYDTLAGIFGNKTKVADWTRQKKEFLEFCADQIEKESEKDTASDISVDNNSQHQAPRYNETELTIFSKWANNEYGHDYSAMYTKDSIIFHLGYRNGYTVQRGEEEALWDDFFERLELDEYVKVSGYDSYRHPIYKITKAGYNFGKTIIDRANEAKKLVKISL